MFSSSTMVKVKESVSCEFSSRSSTSRGSSSGSGSGEGSARDQILRVGSSGLNGGDQKVTGSNPGTSPIKILQHKYYATLFIQEF